MKKIVIAMIIFSFTLVGTLTYIGFKFEESVEDYNILENDMEEAAIIYVDLEKIELKPGQRYEVSLNKLYEYNLLDTTEVNDEECQGYVVIKKTLTKLDYEAFIKCENYQTVDYREE